MTRMAIEILFSADSKVFLYLGPDYEKKQILAHAVPNMRN